LCFVVFAYVILKKITFLAFLSFVIKKNYLKYILFILLI
jgi:hypothetical protein